MSKENASQKLVIVCIECGKSLEVPFSKTARDKLTAFLWKNGEWLLSVVSESGRKEKEEVVMAPLCSTCAPNVYPPEALEAARNHLRKTYGTLN